MKKYKVIWFDDEHENFQSMKDEALLEKVQLIGYSNAKDGIPELKNNYKAYDAVILDGLFLTSTEHSGTDMDQTAFGEVAKVINELKAKGIIMPWFIYSGQISFVKDKNVLVDVLKDSSFANGKVFDKNKDDDFDELLIEIKRAADNQIISQYRHKYPNAFALCSDQYLGDKQFDRVLKIIQDIENAEKIENSQDQLNPLRKIVEAIFKKLSDKRLIPEEIFNNPGWINGCSYFLANKHIGFKQNDVYVLPVIAENFHRLLNIIQDASHGEGNLNLGVDKYIADQKNHYLYISCIYLLLDIMDWFKKFVDNNPDNDKNKLKWTKKEIESPVIDGDWIPGKIVKIENGWGTFKPNSGSPTISIIPTMVTEFTLALDNELEVITTPSMDGLKTHITALKKINQQ